MIDFWESIIATFNSENKCGLCWEFVGAGRADYFNNLQLRTDNECCVYVGLLKFGSKSVIEKNNFGIYDAKYCDNYFELIVGIPSRLDLQFYNENQNIDKAESKYIKFIKPIIDCLGCGISLGCDLQEYEVVEWKYDLLLNFQDFNFDGIKITGTIRKNVI